MAYRLLLPMYIVPFEDMEGPESMAPPRLSDHLSVPLGFIAYKTPLIFPTYTVPLEATAGVPYIEFVVV